MKFTLLTFLPGFYLFFSSLVAGRILQLLHRKPIPVSIRIGLGYIFFGFLIPLGLTSLFSHRVTAYLHLGLLLLALALMWKKGRSLFDSSDLAPRWIGVLSLVSFFIFMLPSFSVRDGGVFTAGGGDITIYSTLSHQVPDESLMSRGSWSNFFNFVIYGKQPIEISVEMNPVTPGNAPFPNWGGSRMHYYTGPAFYLHGWIMPMGFLYYLFSGVGSAAVYFGVLAFIYCTSLLLFADFTWTKTRKPLLSLLSFALPLCSHGFVYTAYCHYYPAWASAFFLLVFLFHLMSTENPSGIVPIGLVILTTILIQNWPVTPFYGIAMLLAVILLGKERLHLNSLVGARGLCLLSIFAIGISLPMFVTAGSRVFSMFSSFVHSGGNHVMSLLYMRSPRKWFSLSLIQSAFGYLQLNNLPPYSLSKFPSALGVRVLTGVGLMGIGTALFYSTRLKKSFGKWVFFLFFMILALGLYAGLGYEYTQFKGISYALPILFVALSVVLSESRDRKVLSAICIFGLTLLVARISLLKELFHQTYPASIVSIGLQQTLKKADPARDSVFLIYPPTPQAIYPIDSIIFDHKYIFARELSYAQYNITLPSIIDAYGLDHLKVAFEDAKRNWQIETLSSRLDKNRYEVVGARYSHNSGSRFEILIGQHQELQLLVEADEKADLLSWNHKSKTYEPILPKSIKNKQSIYYIKTAGTWGAIRVKKEATVKIEAMGSSSIHPG